MKHLKLMALLCLTLSTMEVNAQTSDLSQIEATITGFVQAGIKTTLTNSRPIWMTITE
ncbi:MAG: hypothetical protein ACJAUD_002641 [Crocinitomicaceae bacterium]|jgi:hypothetical protein